MPEGTIRKIALDRGFGFIAGEECDVFFHRSAVDGVHFDELEEGQTVEYDIATTPAPRRRGRPAPQGPRAAYVKPV